MSQCVAILGGTFDPVHRGHIALAEHFVALLHPDELRVIPTGNPWQKDWQLTPFEHRIEMLRRAFDERHIAATIDRREIDRGGPTYTIDTLRQLRSELGAQTSLVLLIGADQLLRLDTWKDWKNLFSYAHVCAATRPGYSLGAADLPAPVAEEFSRRAASPEQIRSTPSGLTCLSLGLAIDTSATQIREALKSGRRPVAALTPAVLDYIDKFHLYRD